MRIALYSDLHREFRDWEPPAIDVDVVILAGDVAVHTRGLDWATTAFRHDGASPEIIYVAGNHEYYGSDYLDMLGQMQSPVWDSSGVHFLERRSLYMKDVRFFGCTLWSGFDLYGADKASEYMSVAQRHINDFLMITTDGGKLLTPQDTRELYRASVAWLDAELGKPYAGKTVVVTHFAPHRRCVAPEHQGSAVSPYFVSDLAWLMEKHRVNLWCYGHTHTNTDFIVEWRDCATGIAEGCRVISNQLGYPGERVRNEFGELLDTGFKSDLVVTL
jgi:predicted phosphodiesterase